MQPRRYASRAGAFSFEVNPQHRTASGGATYHLRRGNEVVWADERPYTLLQAGVSDDGVAGGYGYSCGAPASDSMTFAGERECSLYVVVLDAEGHERAAHKIAVKLVHFIDIGAYPDANVEGLLFDPEHDRMTLRVKAPFSESGVEDWWPYRLSTGEPLPHIRPAGRIETRWKRMDPITEARLVPGTPLTLLHWWRDDPLAKTVGATFTLVDSSGRTVWTLDRPRDYQLPNDPAGEERLRSSLEKSGAILDTRDHAFEVRLDAGGQRASFSVSADARRHGSWLVREIGRSPWKEPPEPADPFDGLPEQSARPLDAVILGQPQGTPDSAIRSIEEFDLDDEGRIGFLRDDGSSGFALVVISDAGDLVREIRLPPVPRNDSYSIAWAAGERWVVSRSRVDAGATAAWWASVADGSLESIAAFRDVVPAWRGLTSWRGQGVLVTVERSERDYDGSGTVTQSLMAVDDAGRVRWKYAGPDSYTSSDGIAALTTGGVVVLTHRNVLILSATGEPERTIDLEKAWEREPHYLARVSADSDGGFIVEEFQGEAEFVRMRPDGSVRGRFKVRAADGRPLGSIRSLRMAPDGRQWASDGESFLRVTDDGRVDLVVGAERSDTALRSLVAAGVDELGHIHALDGGSGVIHTFDSSGRWLHQCGPSLQPGAAGASVWRLPLAWSGIAWARDDPGEDAPNRHVRCDADGGRIGLVTLPKGREPEYLAPDGESYWTTDSTDITLVSASGEVRSKIDRRPDGLWLENINDATVAPDGALAVSSVPEAGWFGGDAAARSAPWSISLYSAYGSPLRTLTLPTACAGRLFAFDGSQLFLTRESQVVVLDLEGRPVQKIQLPLSCEPASCLRLLAPGSDEIWVMEKSRQQLRRFARPPVPASPRAES